MLKFPGSLNFLFHNLSIYQFSRKNTRLAQFIPRIYNKIIIKILGYFRGVTQVKRRGNSNTRSTPGPSSSTWKSNQWKKEEKFQVLIKLRVSISLWFFEELLELIGYSVAFIKTYQSDLHHRLRRPHIYQGSCFHISNGSRSSIQADTRVVLPRLIRSRVSSQVDGVRIILVSEQQVLFYGLPIFY